jgi:hypothetical protein
MPVKENHPVLHQDIRLWFEHPPHLRGLDFRTTQQVNKGHGRLERRVLTASAELRDYLDFPGIQQVFRLERHRLVLRTGRLTTEVIYGVTSLTPKQASPDQLLLLCREHWAIENNLHRVRDVEFGEDACHTWHRNGARVLALCRDLVLGVLRAFGYSNIREARQHFAARPLQALGLFQLSVSSWFT